MTDAPHSDRFGPETVVQFALKVKLRARGRVMTDAAVHPAGCFTEWQMGYPTSRFRDLLNSGAVTMTSIDRDRDVYGRLLRNVAVNGTDVGEAMVSAGVARAYASGRRPWC
jgi:hypothetical protein